MFLFTVKSSLPGMVQLRIVLYPASREKQSFSRHLLLGHAGTFRMMGKVGHFQHVFFGRGTAGNGKSVKRRECDKNAPQGARTYAVKLFGTEMLFCVWLWFALTFYPVSGIQAEKI